MELADEALLYCDEALLALAKPPGLPVHATPDAGRDHLLAAVGRLLVRRGLAANGLGLPHRLDVGTSGLIVLGRQPEVTAQLSALFAARRVQKTYLALTGRVEPLPESRLEVRNHLAANKDRKGVPVVPVRAGGDAAWTTLAVVRQGPRAVLWQATLHTGRRHQIRAHLAGLGMPIVGDLDYDTPIAASRPMLHAARLELRHPVTQVLLRLESPLPADFQAVAARLGLSDLANLAEILQSSA